MTPGRWLVLSALAAVATGDAAAVPCESVPEQRSDGVSPAG